MSIPEGNIWRASATAGRFMSAASQLPIKPVMPLSPAARTYSAHYDMKSDPALRDVMAFEDTDGRHNSYDPQPRSQEDLRKRHRAHRKIADFCLGLMGRTPTRIDRTGTK
jgi:aromatic ring hydroxylase